MEEYRTKCSIFKLARTYKFFDGIFVTDNCIWPGGTKIICISKPLNKGTSNCCMYANYSVCPIIEIVHEFYAQSVIALCTVILKSF